MVEIIVLDIGGTMASKKLSIEDLPNDWAKHGDAFFNAYYDSRQEVRQAVAAVSAKYQITDRRKLVPTVSELIKQKEIAKDPAIIGLMGLVNIDSMETGKLPIEFYPDVRGFLSKWHGFGVGLSTYSNGSASSQAAMFKAAVGGDLRGYFHQTFPHFDTDAIGPKDKLDSYRKICDILQVKPEHATYYNDVRAEAVAAREAGMGAILINRSPDFKVDPEFPTQATL